MPGHDNSSFFVWPGSGLGHRFDVISRRNGVAQNRACTVARTTTPVRSLSVNRKPLRNCLSLAHPPPFRNGVYFLPEASLLNNPGFLAALVVPVTTVPRAKIAQLRHA